VLLPQSELCAVKLSQLLKDLSREKLLSMAQQARALATEGAARAVAAVCAEFAA